MGRDSEACPHCEALKKRLAHADELLTKYRLKMDEASALLVHQNREIHDLRDKLSPPPVSVQKH